MRRREISLFNLSFLDVISCGLGAVVTLLLIAFPAAQEAQARKKAHASLLDRIAEAKAQAESRRAEAAGIRAQIEDLKKDEEKNREAVAALGRYVDQLLAFNFAGVYTEKKRVVVLMDLSGSMASQREDLTAVASALVDFFQGAGAADVRFAVIGFGAQTTAAQPDAFPSAFPGQGLVPMTDANRDHAKRWIVEMAYQRLGGGTPTKRALELAFEIPDVEAVLLLTDGSPDGGGGPVLDRAAELNRGRGVEIHCIGMGKALFEKDEFRVFLQRLATSNHGRFAAFWTRP